ncbi:hypothetical protein FB45DRAFT_359877 [Roridomyces roridus]|uniref:Uncharacterized protein n=1 Tax=Roridomyces roridus TaxID=1738132 RepID=A0AAD7C865_9AGAR|nr:hypothetical protein FB45DRAFT_359877 [Roridomyces roridus]
MRFHSGRGHRGQGQGEGEKKKRVDQPRTRLGVAVCTHRRGPRLLTPKPPIPTLMPVPLMSAPPKPSSESESEYWGGAGAAAFLVRFRLGAGEPRWPWTTGGWGLGLGFPSSRRCSASPLSSWPTAGTWRVRARKAPLCSYWPADAAGVVAVAVVGSRTEPADRRKTSQGLGTQNGIGGIGNCAETGGVVAAAAAAAGESPTRPHRRRAGPGRGCAVADGPLKIGKEETDFDDAAGLRF